MPFHRVTAALLSPASPGLVVLGHSLALGNYLKWRNRRSMGREWREMQTRLAIIEDELTPKAANIVQMRVTRYSHDF